MVRKRSSSEKIIGGVNYEEKSKYCSKINRNVGSSGIIAWNNIIYIWSTFITGKTKEPDKQWT